MKRWVWIGSIVLISTLFCSYFILEMPIKSKEIKAQSFVKTQEAVENNKTEAGAVLDRNNMLKENCYFISKKTEIGKEELEQSGGILKFADSINWKEYQNYRSDKEASADYNSEYKYGARFLDESAEQLIADKVIVLEGYQDICIEDSCGKWIAVSFSVPIMKSESLLYDLQSNTQRGLLIYDKEKETVWISILPKNSRVSVGSSVITENYLYWCEENLFYDSSVWEIKGMDLNTQKEFSICKSEDFTEKKKGNTPKLGSCYQDDLYFYYEYPQEAVKQYVGLSLVRDTAYQMELMCYKPDKDSLDKKAEFSFRYNYDMTPCIGGDFIYTVGYDGNDCYILSYHILSDTYCRYYIKSEYKTEYIQDIHACLGYLVYKTDFGRKCLLDLNTLEVREFNDWVSWTGIVGNKVFFRKIYEKDGWDYCYDLVENQYYQLIKRKDYGSIITGSDKEWVIFDKKEGEVYLFSD